MACDYCDLPEHFGFFLPRRADAFPRVNGGLFEGCNDLPKISHIAHSYLLHTGSPNRKENNPDIFGSVIQAMADDEERGELGMHYTSVPNILKVLNPLFLNDLREQLEQAVKNQRKLLYLSACSDKCSGARFAYRGVILMSDQPPGSSRACEGAPFWICRPAEPTLMPGAKRKWLSTDCPA